MSTELPLSTSTHRVLKSAIDRLMTRALSWGWRSCRVSSSVKLMVGLSTLVILGNRPEIWTLCTICKYVFLSFLEALAIVLPPIITLISPSGALDPSVEFGVPWRVLSAFDKPSKCYDLKQQIKAFIKQGKLQFVALGHNTRKCRAHDLNGNDNTCF